MNCTKKTIAGQHRVNFAEIYVPNDSAAKAIYKKIQQGKNFLELAEKNTIRPGYKEKKGIWGFHPVTAESSFG